MKARRLIRIVVSLALLIVLLELIDVPRMIDTLSSAHVGYLLLAYLLVTLNRLLMPVKWNMLLRAKGIRVGTWEAIRVYYVAGFLGVFLPPTVGADAVRAYSVSRRRGHTADIVASIVVERLLGLLALACFAIIGCVLCLRLFPIEHDAVHRFLSITTWLLIAGVAGVMASLNPTLGRGVTGLIGRLQGRRLVGRFAEKLIKLYDAYRAYGKHRGTLLVFFLLSLLENILPVARAFVIGLALGIDVSLIYFFVIVPLELMAGRLPVSFNGFGIREGMFTFFLTQVGVPASAAFALGLITNLLVLAGFLPGGVLHLTDQMKARSARDKSATTTPLGS